MGWSAGCDCSFLPFYALSGGAIGIEGEGTREAFRKGKIGENIRIVTAISKGGKFDLHPVDPVDAVDEENEDEDKCDLHSILQFGYQWILGDEAVQHTHVRHCDGQSRADLGGGAIRKQSPLDGEWHRKDEEHEKCHLCHEQHEHLR